MNNGSKERSLAGIKASAKFFRIFCKIVMIIMIAATTLSAIGAVILLAIPDSIMSATVDSEYKFTVDFDSLPIARMISEEEFLEGMKSVGFTDAEKTNAGYVFTAGAGSQTITLRNVATSLVPGIIQMIVITVLMYFLSAFFGDLCGSADVFNIAAAKDLRIVSYIVWGSLIVKVICSLFATQSVTFIEIMFAAILMFFVIIYSYAVYSKGGDAPGGDDRTDKTD